MFKLPFNSSYHIAPHILFAKPKKPKGGGGGKKKAAGPPPVPSMPKIDWDLPHTDDLLVPDREYNIPMGRPDPTIKQSAEPEIIRDPLVDSKGRPWPEITWEEWESNNFQSIVDKLTIPEYMDPFLDVQGKPPWSVRKWLGLMPHPEVNALVRGPLESGNWWTKKFRARGYIPSVLCQGTPGGKFDDVYLLLEKKNLSKAFGNFRKIARVPFYLRWTDFDGNYHRCFTSAHRFHLNHINDALYSVQLLKIPEPSKNDRLIYEPWELSHMLERDVYSVNTFGIESMWKGLPVWTGRK